MKAIYLTKDNDQFAARVADIDEAELPEGDVTIAVEYSTLNYKDALAIANKSPVVRKWPMVAGIDAAGTVAASNHPQWKPGDKALINGWGIGENYWGGLAQRIRAKGEWLTRVPAGMTTRQCMAIGTAGYTAMLCVLELVRLDATPEKGDALVTGATGGVGSIAIALLARRGYRVVASTGKTSQADYLKSLGAAEIIDRNTLTEPGKPLQKERWGSVVDAVGSHTLANACAQTRAEGVVTACGLAQGMDFPVTVAPFILRGVTLRGVNCVTVAPARRQEAWDHLAKDLDRKLLESMVTDIGLGDAIPRANDVLAARVRGRLVVDVNR